MEEAREKALQEVTDHYETKLEEKDRQRDQVMTSSIYRTHTHSLIHTLTLTHAHTLIHARTHTHTHAGV